MKLIKGMDLLKLDLQLFGSSGAMTTTNRYINYNITITENWQDKINAISNVTVEVRVWRNNTGYETWGSGTCYCKIDGTTYNSTITTNHKFTYNSNTLVFSKTLNIYHNSDGAKTLTCSAWINHDTFSSNEQSYSQALTYIPRASVLGTISDFTIGNAITIPVTKYSSSFADTLNIYVGDTWIKMVQGLINGQSISFTTSELNTIYANMPNSEEATFKFVNTTYSGPNILGTSPKTAKGTISPFILPTISDVTITEGNTEVVPSSWGVYVKNKSKLTITTTATAGTGSSISSIKTIVNGAIYTGSPITTNVINESGSLRAVITATDKRNRTWTTGKEIEVVDYAEPFIDEFSVVRCDSDGTENDKGTYAKVTLKGGIYSVNGHNTPTYAINYKKITDTEYQTHSFDVAEITIDETTILSDISDNDSYEFVAVIGDYFTNDNPTKKSTPLSSAFTTADYLKGGKGVAFGKVAEKEGVLDVAFDIQDKFGTLINNGLAEYGDGTIDANETLSHLCLAQYNTPNNSFYYVMTLFYGTKSTTTNRTQLAIPYIYDILQIKTVMFVRQYINGEWTEWKTQDSYSTTEQRIGTWTDGKPLYRRVLTQTINSSSWTKDLNFNIETLVDFKGHLKCGNEVFPLNMPLGDYGYTACYYTSNLQRLRLSCSYTIDQATFILEYTKTTD